MPDFTVSANVDTLLQSAAFANFRTSLGLTALATTTPGTGVATALGVNVGSAGAFVTFNGAGGTPSSINLSNGTALPVGSITGLGAGVGTFLATPSGANLATALTTALPATKGGTGLTALGTGVATALGVNANAGGGLIVLADPGADRIPFWDDSAGTYTFLTVGTGLDLTTTTLTATANANAVTLASAAAGAGLMIVSAGADRTATATDTVNTINATTIAVTTLTLGGATVAVRPPSKVTAASYTVGTTDANELYGGTIYVTGAATITIPAVAAGASFTVVTIGAVAVSVDPNAADLIYLDGVALADGDKITNLSTAGDIAVFTYYDATGWYAATNGWTDTN
jgi:hypothetical protein